MVHAGLSEQLVQWRPIISSCLVNRSAFLNNNWLIAPNKIVDATEVSHLMLWITSLLMALCQKLIILIKLLMENVRMFPVLFTRSMENCLLQEQPKECKLP